MENKTKFSISLIALSFILLISFAFKGEKDPLHKRIFNISIVEEKEGSVAKKPIADKIEFKDGKLFSDFLFEKFQYKWLKYRINKDSIYTDSTDTEVRLLEVTSTSTDTKDLTIVIDFVILEWDIEGTIKMTKGDKPKKFFSFVGREKGGKPKKSKKGEKTEGNPTGDAEQKKE